MINNKGESGGEAMRRLLTGYVFCLVLIVLAGNTFAVPALEPYTYTADFSGGSVGPWSSYPPSQDTAYDPTIWVKNRLDADTNKALFREITPNYNIDYMFGARKKFHNLYVDATSVLSFKAYIKSNRPVEGVRLRFGFADGTMQELDVPFTSIELWYSAQISFSNLIEDGKTHKLDAVAFMALCPEADPENLLRFGLDDVSITGYRQADFTFISPEAHILDERPEQIAAVHFAEGGEIEIAGRAPFDAKNVEVTISRALTGADRKTWKMKGKDGVWSTKIRLGKSSDVGSGIWRAKVIAISRDKEPQTSATDLVFLVKKEDAPDSNPKILTTSEELPAVRERTESERMKNVWEGLVRNAEKRRSQRSTDVFKYNLDAYDDIYWLPTYGGYIQALYTPSQYIRSNAVVYGISGDTEAGNAACRALKMMAQWPSWVHPHILNQGQFTYWPVGQVLSDLAVGYDMAGDRLSQADRKLVASALYEKGLTQVFKEYVRDNRVSSNTSNWIGDVTGGGIMCALALMEEYSDRDLEPYLTGMILKLNDLVQSGFDNDGAYGEGYSYLNHALHCINTVLPGLDRTFGIQFPSKLYEAHKLLFYQWDAHTNHLYDWGDTVTSLRSMSNFTWLLNKSGDPLLQWLYDKNPGSSDVDLLLLNKRHESEDIESLPTVTLFEDTGTAVFRSGFDEDAFIFVFRCGPFFNHQHFDQGSFFLADRGEEFLGEVGRSDYYEDPWYQKLVIQPGGHNCILIDGNPESQRAGDLLHDVPAWNDYARISDYMTFEDGAFVSGDLAPLYKGKVETLRRSVLYSAPRTIVLIDEIAGPEDASQMNLLFHPPHREDITVGGPGNVSITRPSGVLKMRSLAGDVNISAEKRPPTLYEFNGLDAVTMKPYGYVKMDSEIGAGTTAVTVMSTDDGVLNSLNSRRFNDLVLLNLGGVTCAVKTAPNGEMEIDGTVTDALVYATLENGFRAMRATHVDDGGKSLFKAEYPVSIELAGNTLTYSASKDTEMTVFMEKKPRRITTEGERIRDWKFSSEKGVTLTVKAGSGSYDIE